MATYASQSLTSATTSTAIPVNPHASGNIPIGIVLDFTTVAAVGTASVQGTFDDLNTVNDGTALWFTLPNFSGKTATTVDSSIIPFRAIRLDVTAYTSGTITLRVLQGDNFGS